MTNLPKIILAALFAASTPHAAAHYHFAAGIVDTIPNNRPDAGEPLIQSGPDPANIIIHLLPRPAGILQQQHCGGYYSVSDISTRTLFPLDDFSLTGLSDGQVEDNDPGHAHTGAWIWAEVTSVTGPPGAHFGFWEVERSAEHDTPTVSFPTNEPTGNYSFVVSEGYDDVEQDPQGHIHGRAWTTDKPGDYAVSFRFVDRSTSGPGGGPWHPPSAIFTLHFKAGPDFQPTGKPVAGSGYVLTWPSRMGIWEPFQTGIVFNVLRTTDPTAGVWTNIGTATGTTAATATFTDPSPPPGKAFYRLAYDWGGTETEASE